jgi:hypothetical protein
MSIEFTISIPEELVPGIVATAALEEKSPEEVVNEYAARLSHQDLPRPQGRPVLHRPHPAPVQCRWNALRRPSRT